MSVRSRIRRGIAIASLAIASIAAAAGTVVLAQAIYYDAILVSETATMPLSAMAQPDEFTRFLSWIAVVVVGAVLLTVTGILWMAVPVWLGGLRMFGGIVVDVAGRRTASATTMLLCAGCNGLGALLFFVWHHFAPSAGHVYVAGIANVVAALVCVTVVGVAHARGTEDG